jgi:hypothetical protein
VKEEHGIHCPREGDYVGKTRIILAVVQGGLVSVDVPLRIT